MFLTLIKIFFSPTCNRPAHHYVSDLFLDDSGLDFDFDLVQLVRFSDDSGFDFDFDLIQLVTLHDSSRTLLIFDFGFGELFILIRVTAQPPTHFDFDLVQLVTLHDYCRTILISGLGNYFILILIQVTAQPLTYFDFRIPTYFNFIFASSWKWFYTGDSLHKWNITTPCIFPARGFDEGLSET